MPPKGRKKAVAAAKSDSNGIEKEILSVQDKIEGIKSGRGRKKAKMAESEDLEDKPVLDVEKEQGAKLDDDVIDEKQIETKKSNGENTSDAIDDGMPVSEADIKPENEDAVGSAEGDVEPEKITSKRGRKKAGDQKSEQVAMKSNGDVLPDIVENETAISKTTEEPDKISDKHGQNKAGVSEDEVAITDSKDEPEKVPDKRGRKKAGVSEEDEVAIAEAEEEPEKVSGKRGRKKAGTSEEIENKAAVIEAKDEPEKVSDKRGRKKAGVSEEDEVATAEAEEEPEKVSGKRGRKKAGTSEEIEDEAAVTEAKEVPEKVLGKRGRKRAGTSEVVEDEVVATKAKEHTLGRRGRKKAGASEEIEDEVAPTEAKEEPEKSVGRHGRKKAEEIETAEPKKDSGKVYGKRNRKKSEDAASAKQDGAMETEEEHAPPTKRSQNTKSGATRKDKVTDKVEEDEDFVPRRTRGGRNVKEAPKEVAPVPKGRKRKAKDDKAEVKQVKKGKAAEEDAEEHLSLAQIDENRQLAVSIERDHKLDEMARNSSLEEEKETKVKLGKGSAGGRKRSNQDAEEAKPEKIQKEEPSKAKSGSKRQQIPDVSDLDFENTSKTPDGKPWNFKIASWNVNGVRAWLEKNGLSYIHHEKPDVLCFQETKCSNDKLPKELAVEGYHCHWLAGDKDGYSGVGVLSKQKPLSITDGIGIEEHDNEGRVITAEYEKFYLVNTYVPNSGRGLVKLDYRKKWDQDFQAYLKTLDEKKPVVLCGDLNVAHEEIDIANPKSNKKSAGFTQEERDGFSSLLKEGFVDTFRHLYPEGKAAYTFWSYMMNARAKNVGWRMDYFVISERFKDLLCDSLIRKEVMGSDHCPVGLLLHV